jgi:hypothetical protein
MQKNQRVADMAVEVLTRQAETRTQQTGEAFEEALAAIQKIPAGDVVVLHEGTVRVGLALGVGGFGVGVLVFLLTALEPLE